MASPSWIWKFGLVGSVISVFDLAISNTAAVKIELVPGGWYLTPASYWRPRVGWNGSPNASVPTVSW